MSSEWSGRVSGARTRGEHGLFEGGGGGSKGVEAEVNRAEA